MRDRPLAIRGDSGTIALTGSTVASDEPGLTGEIDWRDLAACSAHDASLFFPAGESGPAAAQIASAKRICVACDVQEECLLYAVDTNQVNGIWGGLTEEERRPVRRRLLAERRRQALA